MKRTTFITIAVILLLAALGGYIVIRSMGLPGEGVPSTSDPAPLPPEGQIILSVGSEKSAFGVSVEALEVVEDSRCPIDVTCIQAGTVRLRVRIGSALGEDERVMSLGDFVTTEAEVVRFVDVAPVPRSTASIQESAYRFVFTVSKE